MNTRLFLSFFQYESETTNILVIIMIFVSGQFFMVNRRVRHGFNQTSFSIDHNIVSLLFGGDQNEYIQDYYLFVEAQKHGLNLSKAKLDETKNKIPFFWDKNNKFNQNKYNLIKKKYNLSDTEIRHAILIMTFATLMKNILNALPMKYEPLTKIPIFENNGILLDMSRPVNKNYTIDKSDLHLFYLNQYETNKTADFTGIDLVNGKIFFFDRQISKKDCNEKQLEILKYGNSHEVKKVLHDLLRAKKLPVKIKETIVNQQDITSNKHILTGYYNPGEIQKDNKKNYICVIDKIIFNNKPKDINEHQISTGAIDKYYGVTQNRHDIMRAIDLVNKYNNNQISLNNLKKHASLVDKINLSNDPKNNNITDHEFLMLYSQKKAVFLIDSERKPVIFIPIKREIKKYIKTNPFTLISNKEKMNQQLNAFGAFVQPNLLKKIKTLANNLSRKNIGRFIKLIDKIKNNLTLNKAMKILSKSDIIDRQINRLIFLAMKIVDDNKIQPHIMHTVARQANYWYQETIKAK